MTIAVNKKRIREIDGLRGIAILMVVFWHYGNNQLDYGSFIAGNLKIISRLFWSGVDLFFVISGYLICSILINNRDSRNYFKTFYFRRFFRIFPLYYFVLFVFLLLSAFPLVRNVLPDLFSNNIIPWWTYLLYCQNFFMGDLNSLGVGWLSVTWSLAIEEQLYIVLPLLVFIVPKKKLWIILILMILLAPVFRYFSTDWVQMHTSFFCRMDALLSGAFLAVLSSNTKYISLLKAYINYVNVLFLIVFAGMILLTLRIDFIPYFLHYSWITLFYLLMLVIVLYGRMNFIKKILQGTFLSLIGVVSYGIYLYHMIVYYLVEKVVLEIVGDISNMIVFFIGLISLIITVLVSYYSFNIFEKKLIKIGYRYHY